MVMYTPENWRMISCTVQSLSRSLCFLIESNNLLLFILSSKDVITLFLLRYVMFFQSRRNSCLKKPIAPTWPWRDPGKTVGRRGQVHQGNYEMYAKEKRQTEPILQLLTIKNTAGKISPEYFTNVLSNLTRPYSPFISQACLNFAGAPGHALFLVKLCTFHFQIMAPDINYH